MSMLSLRLPESLHRMLRDVAAKGRDGRTLRGSTVF